MHISMGKKFLISGLIIFYEQWFFLQVNHTVEFKFHPKSYYTGNKISLASSILLILAIAGYGFSEFRKKKKKVTFQRKQIND